MEDSVAFCVVLHKWAPCSSSAFHVCRKLSIIRIGARERQRLACELHDGLGQDLYGLALHVASMETAAKRNGLPIASDLCRLGAIANGTIESCRKIAHGLSPLGTLQGGLVEALKGLTTMPVDWRGSTVQFKLIETSLLLLPLENVHHLYRIAQEAFANAIRHSQAKTITVRLEILPAKVRLEMQARPRTAWA